MTEAEMFEALRRLTFEIVMAKTEERMKEIDAYITKYAKENNIPEWIVDKVYIESGAGSLVSMMP